MIVAAWDGLRSKGTFEEALGHGCFDHLRGKVDDPDAFFFLRIRRREVWPYWREKQGGWAASSPASESWSSSKLYEQWDEDTLLDMIEVLHDVASRPVRSGLRYASDECDGYYGPPFDQTRGRREYAARMNEVLAHHDPPYELVEGRIVVKTPDEYRKLMDAPVPSTADHDSVTVKIEHAKQVFAMRGVSVEDRRDAVKSLADVLEVLRPEVRKTLGRPDEGALFEIANGFGIRHNKRGQRRDYDHPAWLQWAFYIYLSTIHVVLYLKERESLNVEPGSHDARKTTSGLPDSG
ncbi:MAG: hypothetical protein WC558_11320 [Patulibacter sp.]